MLATHLSICLSVNLHISIYLPIHLHIHVYFILRHAHVLVALTALHKEVGASGLKVLCSY